MTYYVDLDQVGTGDGSSGNPFNYSQFIAQVPSRGDTFKLKGSIDLPSDLLLDYGIPFNIVAWDLIQFGPWRIKGTRPIVYNIKLLVGAGNISGGIIDSENFLGVQGTISNSFINAIAGLQTWLYSCTFNGCTLIVSTPILNAIVNDCILDGPMDSGVASSTFNNCTFSVADWGSGTKNEFCQFSWTPPAWPAWDASDFSKATLGYSSIKYVTDVPSGPRPGAGSPTYTGYPLDLAGVARDDIGAYASSELPTTTTAEPTTTTTTTTTTAEPTTTTTTTTTAGPTPPPPSFYIDPTDPTKEYHFLGGNLYLEVEDSQLAVISGNTIIN